MSKPANRFIATLPPSLRVAIPLALPLSLVPQASTPAITFNFDFDRTVPEQLQMATQEAASLWSPLLKDNTIVRLRVDYSDLSTAGSVLAGVQPGKVKVKYEDYANALFRDATSSNDFLGVSNLQLSAKGREAIQDYQAGELDLKSAKLESKAFAFLMDGQFSNGRGSQNYWKRPQADFLDNNGNDNNKHIQLTRAQAKSLDLIDNKSNKLDAVITINSNVDWDFNRRDGIDANKYDPVTVLQHEIGHALGIVSGTDTLDFLTAIGGSDTLKDIEKNKFSYLTPIDFYRYSNESAQLGVIDLTIGGSEKYFSLDGGKSVVTDELGRPAYFSTGSLDSDGDGYQGSHWKSNNNPLGVMNPILQPGKSIDISQLDLTLLDAIGWDLEDATAQRAAAVGVDWAFMTDQLAKDRQATMDDLKRTWGSDIPELEAAINDASFDLEFEFQQKIKEKLDDLTDKLEKETDFEKRSKERTKFYEEVAKESDKRDEKLRKLPKEIYKTDESVRKWLTLSTDKLSEEMRKADAKKINRFSNIVKALPADEQAAAELRIESAVARFVDEPDKLVEELLKTSGPANPIGWSYFRWYWWWMEGETINDDFDFEDDGFDFEDDDFDFEDDDFDFEDDFEDVIEANGNLTSFYYYQAAASSASATSALAKERSILSSFSQESTANNTFKNTSTLAPLNGSDGSAQEIPEPSSILALFGIAVLGAKQLRPRVKNERLIDNRCD